MRMAKPSPCRRSTDLATAPSARRSACRRAGDPVPCSCEHTAEEGAAEVHLRACYARLAKTPPSNSIETLLSCFTSTTWSAFSSPATSGDLHLCSCAWLRIPHGVCGKPRASQQ